MVIVYRGYNNHSNRLFQAIHIESFCKANNIKFYNPSFWDMAKYYGIKQGYIDGLVSFVLHILCKIKILNGLKLKDFKLHEYYAESIKKKKIVFVRGWRFRNFNHTLTYKDFFTRKYQLLPCYYQDNWLYKYVMSLNRLKVCIVGVHIRRGDYKNWENGAHYFEDSVYQNYINNFENEIVTKTGKQTVFLIFSNEKITLDVRENCILSNNEWYIDQYLLSLCDFIIGPISTFTLWSSYVGNVKYFHINNASGNITIDDFSQCSG